MTTINFMTHSIEHCSEHGDYIGEVGCGPCEQKWYFEEMSEMQGDASQVEEVEPDAVASIDDEDILF